MGPGTGSTRHGGFPGKANGLITTRNYERENNSFETLRQNQYEKDAPMNVFSLLPARTCRGAWTVTEPLKKNNQGQK